MVTQPRWLQAFALLAVTTLATALAVPLAAEASPASASSSASASSPASTVTSDALPTVQVDGVVWSQIVVGNTVYVGGEFTTAQPAGAAAGVGTVTRSDMLAYDLTTGELITTFAPVFNAQVRGLAASADGSTIYAVGNFTQVNGVNKYRTVALNASTGAVLTKFKATADSAVTAVGVSGSTVYLGGAFSSLNSTTRSRAAAVDATTGALLPWAPVAADNYVRALVVSPDGSKVVLGGNFSSLNGSTSPGSGLGAVDAVTGASLPWKVGNLIFDHGTKSSIMSLSSDGTNVYGTGYVFGSAKTDGNLEGTFSASWTDGSITWIEDCHGDTYSVAVSRDAVYTASHAHYCDNVPGGFPQSESNSTTATKQRAVAFSTAATGVLAHNSYGSSSTYADFGGQPAPTLLTWYPDFAAGTYTGQGQAAWSVASGGGYVLYGGEFPTVNGKRQTGLVRFATKAVAPNTDGPAVSGANWVPTALSLSSGSVRVGWKADYDRDDAVLTYAVYRNGGTTPVYTTTAESRSWWLRPKLAFTDTGLTPGATATYKVKATDSSGNTVTSATVSAVVSGGAAAAASKYANLVQADGAAHLWRFNEASGSTAYDRVGSDDLTTGTGVTLGTAGAIAGETGAAASFSGASTAFAATSDAIAAPKTFTVEAWFRTTSTSGGKIVGFGDAKTGNSANFDRHVYMDTSGRVLFGVNPGTKVTLQSAKGLNDGMWHEVVASLGAGGMSLSVDGKAVASRTDVTAAQSIFGYWRVGGDASWSGAADFKGSIDDVAIYGSALTSDQVSAHYRLGTGTFVGNVAPVASFTASTSGLTVSTDASASSDPDGTIKSVAWDFGDGATGTGTTAKHAYAATGSYAVTAIVTDDAGSATKATRTVSVVAPNQVPTAAFTSTSTGLTTVFDATGSDDPDGTLASYRWDFGDGATGTGSTPSHTYAADGTYAVVLTVTDDRGATATATKQATAAAPVAPVLATDAFGRAVAGGLGQADAGGSWTVSGGAANTSVSDGAARISTAKGATVSAYLGGVSSTSNDVSATVAVPVLPVGGSAFSSVIGRRVGTDDYSGRAIIAASGAVTVDVVHGGTSMNAAKVAGITTTPGMQLRIRVQVVGTTPTTVRARVWAAGTAEPTTWQATATDDTAGLQAPGAIGIRSYLGSGVTNGPIALAIDDFGAKAAQ